MAIDWNKEIKIGGSGELVLPTKTTMNLLPQQSSTSNIGKIILWVILGVLLAALVGKFGIYDLFVAADNKEAELQTAQQNFESLAAQLSDYDEVQAEYRSYVGIESGDEESIDALRAMELVASAIEPSATVTAAGASGTTLTVTIKDIPLDSVGRLADTLRAQPLVSDVAVSTANSSDEANVTAMLQITLTSEAEKGK